MEQFIKDIYELSEPNIYEQGRELSSYNFSVDKKYLEKDKITYYTTKATFGYETVQMNISVDENYHITYYYCNCLHQRIYSRKFCKHLAAFALYIYQNIFKQGIKNDVLEAEIIDDEETLTKLEKKRVYQNLLDQYNKDYKYGNLYENENKEKTHLKVSLTIGGGKNY